MSRTARIALAVIAFTAIPRILLGARFRFLVPPPGTNQGEAARIRIAGETWDLPGPVSRALSLRRCAPLVTRIDQTIVFAMCFASSRSFSDSRMITAVSSIARPVTSITGQFACCAKMFCAYSSSALTWSFRP